MYMHVEDFMILVCTKYPELTKEDMEELYNYYYYQESDVSVITWLDNSKIYDSESTLIENEEAYDTVYLDKNRVILFFNYKGRK